MSNKVLIICGSPHVNSHSDVLAKAFAAGAQENGKAVEIVKLVEKEIAPCNGCTACQKSGDWKCIINDDMQNIYSSVQEADAIVLVTPLYFLTVSAQLKIFIDRLYSKHHAKLIRDKKGVLISTSGGPGSDVIINYFDAFCSLIGWENVGVITQGGLRRDNADGPAEAKKAEAYELGKNI